MLREKSFQCNGPLRTIFRDICSVQRVASFWKQFKSVTCLQIRVRNIRCESALQVGVASWPVLHGLKSQRSRSDLEKRAVSLGSRTEFDLSAECKKELKKYRPTPLLFTFRLEKAKMSRRMLPKCCGNVGCVSDSNPRRALGWRHR